MAIKRVDKLGLTGGVAAAIAVGAVLRLVDLGYQSYSMDELWEFTIVHLPAKEIVSVGDGFPPLFHLVFHALLVGGFSDFAGRILAAVLGIVTIWLASRIGSRVGPGVGTATAWVVAAAPLLVMLSKEARAYGIFVFLAGLLLLTTWDVIDSGTARSWAGFVVVAALGMYTHYMFALALVAAEIVILWNTRRDRDRMGAWLLAHGVVAVLLIPLVFIAIPDLALDAANEYSPTVEVAAIGYAGLSLFSGTTLGPSSRALHTIDTTTAIRDGLPWIILIGVPAAYLLYAGWKALSAQWRFRLGVPLILPIVLLTVLSAGIGTAFRVRYLSWLVLPLAVWLAAGYLHARGSLRHVAAGMLVLAAGIAMIGRDTVDDYRVEDARGAAEYIAEHPDLPAVGMAWYMTKPIEYYLGLDTAIELPEDEGALRFHYHNLPGSRIIPLPSVSSDDPDMTEQAEVFDSAVALGQEYLFVRSREFHADAEDAYFDERVASDGLEPVAEYAGITIYKGVRRS